MSEPVVVFSSASEIEASVVRGLLEANGIEAVMVAGAVRRLFPMSVSALGEAQVAVPAPLADAATALIADYRRDLDGPRVVQMSAEAHALEQRIGYRFRDRGLLEQALTHSSRAQEDETGGVIDNESLEFLGDAVLGFVVADALFRELADFDEGRKSKVKAALVATPMLARMAERLDLGGQLLLGRGEEKTGGRQKQALLADACEALIAAIYLDGGVEAVRAFILRELRPWLDRARQPGALTAVTGDYKSALQEWLQAESLSPPDYRVVEERGPAHRREFTVELWSSGVRLATASGFTKKEAEQAAARSVLEERGVLEAGLE